MSGVLSQIEGHDDVQAKDESWNSYDQIKKPNMKPDMKCKYD